MDLVRLYLNEIGQIPLLTHEQEIAYGKQVQQMMRYLAAKKCLSEKLCCEPTLDEWAQHLGISSSQLAQTIRIGQKTSPKNAHASL